MKNWGTVLSRLNSVALNTNRESTTMKEMSSIFESYYLVYIHRTTLGHPHNTKAPHTYMYYK